MTTRRHRTTMSLAEAARRAGLGRPMAYALARREELPFPWLRVGRRIVVPVRSFERWLYDRARYPRQSGPDGEAAACSHCSDKRL